jgi:putative transposase
MHNILIPLLSAFFAGFRTRLALQMEIVALRQQLNVMRRSVPKRPKLYASDRFFWVLLSRFWPDWRSALILIKPETVIAWHRKGFRLFWS